MTTSHADAYNGQAMSATTETLAAFGDLIARVGTAVVFSHSATARVSRAYPVHRTDEPGLVVEFAHAPSIIQVINFAQPQTAHRHLLHTDGRGVTLTTVEGVPWRTIRVPDDAIGAVDIAL